MRHLALPTLALFAAVLPAPCQRAADAGDLVPMEPIELRIHQWRDANHVPGMTVAVAADHLDLWVRAFGVADLEQDVPARPETVYRLASISKPITAIAVMQLVEAGRLDLDRPVSEIVRAWPEKEWPITSRQLLGHLAGVRHYKAGDPRGSTLHYPDVTTSLILFQDDPLLHEPGTAYRYTTFGFNLLGAVVEAASDQTFNTYLQEHVYRPAGTQALQDDDPRRLIPGRAPGYVRTQSGSHRNSRLVDISYKVPGGGLCARAGDLVLLGRALMDGKLVQPESLDAMWTSQATRDGKATGYGMGFRVRGDAGARKVGHSGAQSQVSTGWALRPDQGRVVVAVCCNLEGVRPMALADEIADAVAGMVPAAADKCPGAAGREDRPTGRIGPWESFAARHEARHLRPRSRVPAAGRPRGLDDLRGPGTGGRPRGPAHRPRGRGAARG